MSHARDEDTRRRLQHAASEAAGRAGEALGQMVGATIHASARVHLAEPGFPPPPASDEVATLFGVEGVKDCTFLVSFPTGTLDAVRQMMAPGTDATSVPDSMVALEVANICTSHFLNSIGDLIEKRLLPSPPATSAGWGEAQKGGFVIEVTFETPAGMHFGGTFHFRPGPEIIEALQSSVHLTKRT